MKFYKTDYMVFTNVYGYDCFDTIGFVNYNEALEHLQSNKLFRISGNTVFSKFFYGEVISKITGMNFCSYVGCV